MIFGIATALLLAALTACNGGISTLAVITVIIVRPQVAGLNLFRLVMTREQPKVGIQAGMAWSRAMSA